MPRDPVCGRMVDTDTPFKAALNDETYYFCSPDCLEEFEYSTDESIEPVEEERERLD